MAGKQPLKKKEVKSFNVKDFKSNFLGTKASKTADKELEWLIMPQAFQEAVKLPGIPMGRTTMVRGWSDTGKSTLITLGNVYDDNRTVYKVDFNTNELSTNDDDEIYYMSHNKPQYKVGRWIDEDTVLYNKENNTFTRNGEVINSKDYRVKGDKV